MNTQGSQGALWRRGAPGKQGGVSIVLVALALFMLLAFTALSVDGGNLFVARNELHNAADAGALAGARFLYTEDGSSVNPQANAHAESAAKANNSQNSEVEVVSVKRGHWSFGSRTFTPDESLDPVDLHEKTTAELDVYDPYEPFINAVEVVTAREQTPVAAFFGRVLGFEGYEASARAVAYIGFAGTLRPEDVDQPIAMCREAITDGDSYSCDVGRFIPEGDQTGGWTNFAHDDSGASSASELKALICGDGNPEEMHFGEDISTNNGQVQAAFQALYECWVEETDKERLWSLTLPVVDCEEGIAPSNPLVGAVNLNIAWIVDQANKIDDDAPWKMEEPPEDSEGVSPGTWENSDPDGVTRWDDFVTAMNIRDSDGSLATWSSDSQESGWRQKSIYFLPSCSYHEPKGQSGGENFGILAEIPVLVD
ncbi:TadG family pilus assembly protein [Billgrantia lactosivorans]|uniref:TadG family pilus assembly protein n=1 Tax=Billgrantia lactosivorans TaxID=2185141 RepID=UPI000DAEB1BF|nr:TadG family pilus assembly protein [Halomonas lactosivorans]